LLSLCCGKPRPASDQYALGAVVYEWFCGERPFRGSFPEMAAQHLNAVVDVKNPNPGTGSIQVTMTRLEGNTNGGIWIATAAASNGMSITAPASRDS
jgi:hypothetical protein